ncbi:MAG: hypothetical protein M1457_02035 [bacterium]|nr:hypothetical protein [bacterium]
MKIRQFFHEYVWGEVPARATPRQRRAAAALWGGALVLIAVWVGWRRQRAGLPAGLLPSGLAGAGILLGLTLLAGEAGNRVYFACMRAAAVVGFVVNHVLLSAFFYLVVTPMGWALRLAGNDFLQTRKGISPAWHAHTRNDERRRYYRLF